MAEPPALRWGIVGPGAIARVFGASLKLSGVGHVAAVTGRSEERSHDLIDELGVEARALPSVADLVGDDGVDAVYVATPHVHHDAVVRAALDAGKPVLCEKPLTASAADTEALWAYVAKAKGTLLEGWMYRHHPQFLRGLNQIRLGSIGRVARVKAKFAFSEPFDPEHRLYDPELGGGAILDVGGYPVSAALAIARAALGGEDEDAPPAPTTTHFTGTLSESGVEDHAQATLGFDGGITADLMASIRRKAGMEIEVIGTSGKLRLDQPFLPENKRQGRKGRVHVESDGWPERMDVVVAKLDCFALEAQELAAMVAEGRTEPREPCVHSKESVAIARLLDQWREGVREAIRKAQEAAESGDGFAGGQERRRS